MRSGIRVVFVARSMTGAGGGIGGQAALAHQLEDAIPGHLAGGCGRFGRGAPRVWSRAKPGRGIGGPGATGHSEGEYPWNQTPHQSLLYSRCGAERRPRRCPGEAFQKPYPYRCGASMTGCMWVAIDAAPPAAWLLHARPVLGGQSPPGATGPEWRSQAIWRRAFPPAPDRSCPGPFPNDHRARYSTALRHGRCAAAAPPVPAWVCAQSWT